MPAMSDARGTLDGFLTDGAVLIVDADMDVGGAPDLRGRRNHGHGVKKISRDVHPTEGDRDRNGHAGRTPHIVAEEPEGETHIALMGGYDVGAVLTIQKANNSVEVFFCLQELGKNVQDITLVVLHLSFVHRSV